MGVEKYFNSVGLHLTGSLTLENVSTIHKIPELGLVLHAAVRIQEVAIKKVILVSSVGSKFVS